jgi:predicted Fe-Mo cluster-binding NifX family protein
MVICVPVTSGGEVDGSWGRAPRVAVANVEGETVDRWQEFDVGWDELHDTGTEGGHHARVARFVQEHGVQLVIARHVGPDMLHMLERMGVSVQLGASGDARQAAVLSGSAAARRVGPSASG